MKTFVGEHETIDFKIEVVFNDNLEVIRKIATDKVTEKETSYSINSGILAKNTDQDGSVKYFISYTFVDIKLENVREL